MTNFDVIGAVELTTSAAILVAALSVLAGHDAVQRIKYSAILDGGAGQRTRNRRAGPRNRRGGANDLDLHRADARDVATIGT
jgi:hypothetical protein